MKLSLEPSQGRRHHGEPFDLVLAYDVRGLPDGEDAYITNTDYPRQLWTITRVQSGVHGERTGNYESAEDALAALREEYK